jgi:hypothetical protein
LFLEETFLRFTFASEKKQEPSLEHVYHRGHALFCCAENETVATNTARFRVGALPSSKLSSIVQ